MKAPAPKLKNGHTPRKLSNPWRSSYKGGYRQSWRTSYGPGQRFDGFSADPPFSYMPPAGWRVIETIQVTSENQSVFTRDLGNCTPLQSSVDSVVDPTGLPAFVPKVGWWVVSMVNDNTNVEDFVWIGPGGSPAVQVNVCANTEGGISTAGGGGGGTTSSVGFPWGTVILLAGGGYLVYKLLGNKGSKPTRGRTARARR